ncbi:FAD-dependent oxidoreductase [Nocardioides sp.]|uniref:flavin-containing monooxygenase n=1 Tax=Nocardioides sp. TaxID=35761 RepID=UPI003D0ED7D4
MTADRHELLEASDETIEDAVGYADAMVLRGLLYQLTGDEMLASDIPVDEVRAPLAGMTKTVADPDAIATIREKAATFLKAHRDAGAPDLSIGPVERLRHSLSLSAGTEVPEAEFEMWQEQLAVDPYARGLEWSAEPSPERLGSFLVVVIGAGMAGLNAAVQLRHAGIPFIVIDKNPQVGGTWFENRYPGCRVDTPSRGYTHIFGANFPYPSPFCPQEENEKYVNWVADNFELREHMVHNTEVTSVIWDEDDSTWQISANGPDGARSWRAQVVITAVGLLSRPNVPAIAGIERFEGPAFHTARWPAGEAGDMKGKRIAVAGSGCTGYQLVAELSKQVDHLYLFQRTPNWIFEVPGYLSPYPEQVTWLDRNFPYLVNFARFATAWAQRPSLTAHPMEIDPTFEDPYSVSAANKEVRDLRVDYLRNKFADRPDLFDMMLPKQPALSHRPVLVDADDNIYDALLRDNVTLVPEGISQVSEHGVISQDGTEYPVDAIALATGFRANEFLMPMEVRGHNGMTPQDLWAKDGGRAYLGGMIPGFPNFFMLYGPNTNANVGFSAIHLQELITRFALECTEALITRDKKSVEVTEEAYWRYNDELDRVAATKAWMDPRAHSYFTNEFGRSATNGAFDARLLWAWLRDPRQPEAAAPIHSDEVEVMKNRDLLHPYFGEDLQLH